MSNVKVPNLTKALLQEAEKEWIYNFSDGYDPKKHRKLFLKAAQEGLEKGLTTFNIKDAFDESCGYEIEDYANGYMLKLSSYTQADLNLASKDKNFPEFHKIIEKKVTRFVKYKTEQQKKPLPKNLDQIVNYALLCAMKSFNPEFYLLRGCRIEIGNSIRTLVSELGKLTPKETEKFHKIGKKILIAHVPKWSHVGVDRKLLEEAANRGLENALKNSNSFLKGFGFEFQCKSEIDQEIRKILTYPPYPVEVDCAKTPSILKGDFLQDIKNAQGTSLEDLKKKIEKLGFSVEDQDWSEIALEALNPFQQSFLGFFCDHFTEVFKPFSIKFFHAYAKDSSFMNPADNAWRLDKESIANVSIRPPESDDKISWHFVMEAHFNVGHDDFRASERRVVFTFEGWKLVDTGVGD